MLRRNRLHSIGWTVDGWNAGWLQVLLLPPTFQRHAFRALVNWLVYTDCPNVSVNGYLSLYVRPMMSMVFPGCRLKVAGISHQWSGVKVRKTTLLKEKNCTTAQCAFSFTPAPSCSTVFKPDLLISMVTVSTHFSCFCTAVLEMEF